MLEHTGAALSASESAASVLTRFRRATELRLQHLQGDGDPDDVLERPDREAELDQAAAATEPLARTIEQFLRRHLDGMGGEPARGARAGRAAGAGAKSFGATASDGASTSGVKGGAQGGVEGGGKRGVESDVDGGVEGGVEGDADGGVDGVSKGAAEPGALLVSLSGGVDSMVLAHVLLKLQPRHGRAVCAVHIDYANRAESGAEADFLRRWCTARGVALRVRTVSEPTC